MKSQEPQTTPSLRPRKASARPIRPPWWANTAASISKLSPEILDSDGIHEATQLLYRVYTQEQGWDPPGPNPSELRADHRTARLLDAFTEDATWLGLRDRGGRLIATIRLIDRQRFDKLEIERYIDLPGELAKASMEANRVAVARSHRRSPALVVLQTLSCHVARQLGAKWSLATAYENIVMGPARAYGWEPTGHSFRYHPSDPEDVLVMRYDLRLRHQAAVLGAVVRRRLTRVLRKKRDTDVQA